MPRIVAALVRHGAYDQPTNVPSAHLPHPLTADGIEQSRGAAQGILDTAADLDCRVHHVIDSSSLLRAWQTATVLGEELRALTGRTMEIVQFDDLVERSVGAAANLSAEEIEQVIARDPRREPLRPGWRRDLTGRLPFIGAESMVESGERVARHLEVRTSELADAGETDVLKIVVGHGGSFRLCAVVLGLMDLATANERSMHHVTPVYLERTGAGQWRHAAGAWKERNVTVPGDADG